VLPQLHGFLACSRGAGRPATHGAIGANSLDDTIIGPVNIQTPASDLWGKQVHQACARIPKTYLKRANKRGPRVLLLQVKNYEGDVEELGLVFVVEEEHLGVRKEFPLVPKGADQPVTEANKLLYVHLAARWHIVRVNGRAVSLFAHGLSQVNFPLFCL
jgi:hypothetical protein